MNFLMKLNCERTTIWMFLINKSSALSALLALLLVYVPVVNAQHNLVMYNMQQVPQSNLLNPAQIPLVRGHVGLPILSGVRVGAGNTGFTFDQFDMAEMNDSYDFDYAGLRERLKSGNNRVVVDNEIRFLSLGLRRGNGYFSFDIGDASFASGNYTQDMLSMFDDVQQHRLGPETADTLYDQSQHRLMAAYYRSYSLGYAHQIRPNLSVGARFRFLQGVAGAWAENNGLMFRYPGTGNYFQVQGQMALFASGLDISKDAEVFSVLFPGGNTGFAFDIGGVYRVNDQIEVSFSAVNLGRIKWRNNVNYEIVASHLHFSAIDIEEHMNLWGDIAEEWATGEIANEDLYFMTPLPQRFFLGGNYYLNPNTSVGVIVNPVRFNGVTDMAFAVSGNTRVGKVLGLSTALAYNRYTPFNLGFGATVNLGIVQIYAATDNLIGAVNWKSGRAVQGQFGINLNFGSMQRSETLPGFDAMVDAADTTGIYPAEQPDSQSINTAFQTPSDDQKPSSGNAVTRPSGEMNSSEIFRLTGRARDLESGQSLQGIQVEVYKIDDTGEKELELIRGFLDGQLSVALTPGATYQILVNKQGYETTEILIAKNKLQTGELAPNRDVLLRKIQVAAPRPERTTPPPAVVLKEEESTLPSSPAEPFTLPDVPEEARQPAPVAETKIQPEEKSVAAQSAEIYRLTGSTSLRVGPTHTTGVILRFDVGDRVEVLEKTNEWWWKVRFKGQTGYVKAQSLER